MPHYENFDLFEVFTEDCSGNISITDGSTRPEWNNNNILWTKFNSMDGDLPDGGVAVFGDVSGSDTLTFTKLTPQPAGILSRQEFVFRKL